MKAKFIIWHCVVASFFKLSNLKLLAPTPYVAQVKFYAV